MATDTNSAWSNVRCALNICPEDSEHDPKCQRAIDAGPRRFMYVARAACGKVMAGCWIEPDDPMAAEKFAAGRKADGYVVERVSGCPPLSEWISEGFDAAVDAARTAQLKS
jgi:hypothetical protein